MKKNIYLLFLGCFAMSTDCLGKTNIDYIVDTNSINVVVAGNNAFALSLYGKLKDDSKGNIFFSPYSISMAFAMIYGGTCGQTRTQMAEALHFALPDEQLYPVLGDLHKRLTQEVTPYKGQFLMANALWLQKDISYLKEFRELTAPLDAGYYQLDFINETEQSRKAINSWVEEKTKNKIRNVVPPGGVNSNTELVLSNAIYFKNEWKTKFRWWKTRKSDFLVSADRKVKVPLMHLKEKFKYYSNESLQAIELPYKGDEMAMLVLLPREAEGLRKIEDTLTAEILDMILSKMWSPKVDVYLPRFKVTWETDSLKNILAALGMPDAFDSERADFSGLTVHNGLCISDVFHKAFVEVNEEGTEASAATIGVLVKAKLSEPVFRADHPFLFMIRDNRSGSILFMGRVMNPAEEE